jgi:predicted house-cleaning NTP pyrophosphatase (Maf/HAM1 superfamily)
MISHVHWPTRRASHLALRNGMFRSPLGRFQHEDCSCLSISQTSVGYAWPYEICSSGVDEKAVRDNNPARLTRKRAEAQARKVASECPDAVVVSGDAVVSKGARIYEKPRSKDETAQFPRELSGSELQFVTASFQSVRNSWYAFFAFDVSLDRQTT